MDDDIDVVLAQSSRQADNVSRQAAEEFRMRPQSPRRAHAVQRHLEDVDARITQAIRRPSRFVWDNRDGFHSEGC